MIGRRCRFPHIIVVFVFVIGPYRKTCNVDLRVPRPALHVEPTEIRPFRSPGGKDQREASPCSRPIYSSETKHAIQAARASKWRTNLPVSGALRAVSLVRNMADMSHLQPDGWTIRGQCGDNSATIPRQYPAGKSSGLGAKSCRELYTVYTRLLSWRSGNTRTPCLGCREPAYLWAYRARWSVRMEANGSRGTWNPRGGEGVGGAGRGKRSKHASAKVR
ncbi:hypothetical protein EGW08_003782 [Elysia chlorotica]|uniref:Uncharacterized protein n=1 Tax=Elysia chlorotica TaxID=188477 RepID=A0A433U3R0_ELYCH|nr:hypothetical protein EGW08_003782 [Elysia chlorotica]